MGRRQHFPSGEREAALAQWPWGSPRGRDPARDPTEGGERALGGIAMPPATRRGQHSPRKWQPHRESGWRTAGQRFGSLCNDPPKESKQHSGTEAARKTLAGAATQVPHREGKGGGTRHCLNHS